VNGLPVFPPSEVFGGVDELEPAVVVVQVALALTRTQLATAIGIGFAGIAGDVAAEDLTDGQVRHEVEGHLAAEALIALDQQAEADRLRVWPAEQQRILDLLAAATLRAYGIGEAQ
jgi:hypothetical protein